MDAGVALAPCQIAYQTYGTLNADRIERRPRLPRADRRPARRRHATRSPASPAGGTRMVGPGKPIDTDRYLRHLRRTCIGGCMGSTGPASTNPATGEPYGLDFPVITIRDMVRAQAMLLDASASRACSAWSAARWAACRCCNGRRAIPSGCSPRCRSPRPRATRPRTSPSTRSGRQAIMADPDWRGGRYLEEGARPEKGLAVARMAAHITYLSEAALHRKFGRKLQDRDAPTFALRRRLPDRELPAPPGPSLRRPLRRQLLPLHHPGDGLFRPRRGSRRRARRRLPGHADALLRDVLHLRLAVPDRRIRAPSSTRSTPPARRSASSRSRATRATTPSCSTSRRCSPPSRGFLDAAARARGIDERRQA